VYKAEVAIFMQGSFLMTLQSA